MAKIKASFFELSGKLGELVFVNNKIHGAYVRMPRGSGKKAVLNDQLQQNADKAKQVTGVAKSVYRALLPCCGSFRQRDLWQMILKRMYPVLPAHPAGLVTSLTGLEMHSAYPLSRLQPCLQTDISADLSSLLLTLTTQSHPCFQPALRADSYRYKVHLIWLTTTCELIKTAEEASGWIACADACEQRQFSFLTPPQADYFIVLLQLKGGRGNEPIEAMLSTGMQIVAAGAVGVTHGEEMPDPTEEPD